MWFLLSSIVSQLRYFFSKFTWNITDIFSGRDDANHLKSLRESRRKIRNKFVMKLLLLATQHADSVDRQHQHGCLLAGAGYRRRDSQRDEWRSCSCKMCLLRDVIKLWVEYYYLTAAEKKTKCDTLLILWPMSSELWIFSNYFIHQQRSRVVEVISTFSSLLAHSARQRSSVERCCLFAYSSRRFLCGFNEKLLNMASQSGAKIGSKSRQIASLDLTQ